jgi:uncharacterized membrane protein YkoI
MKRQLLIAALLLGAVAPAAAAAQDNARPVFGAGRGDQETARDAVRSGRQVPLSRILAMIAARTPGRHLNSTLGDAGGHPAYFVQWQLSNGRVVVFVVDAESGQMIGQQGG